MHIFNVNEKLIRNGGSNDFDDRNFTRAYRLVVGSPRSDASDLIAPKFSLFCFRK